RNGAGDVRADVDVGRQDVGKAGLEQDIVEREGFADRVIAGGKSHLPTPFGGAAPRTSRDERRPRLHQSARPSNRSPSVGLTLVPRMVADRIKGSDCHAQLFVTGWAVPEPGSCEPGRHARRAHVTPDLGMPRPSAIASMTVG